MQGNPPKICFLADSHDLYDDRIYWKQALSLLKHGFSVYYILAGDREEDGITKDGIIYSMIPRDRYPANRYINYLMKRLPGSLYSRLFNKAAAVEADVYHIQDLKVNRIGDKLRNLPFKPKLIYDVHEPYPENILDYWKENPYLKPFRVYWAKHIRKWERRSVANYDMIITTEENIQRRFKSYFPDKPVEVIYNYTNLDGDSKPLSLNEKEYDLIYTGGITRIRGAWQIIEAVKILANDKPNIKMLFIGSWFPDDLKSKMKDFIISNGLSDNVIMKDAVPYSEIGEYYKRSKIGLGIFLPILTHKIILQIKIFEYMLFGLPIIGSNFGHIGNIIEEYDCGIGVDPENLNDIVEAVKKLLTDKDVYTKMSDNSSRAVQKNFRWELMEEKLIEIYKELLNG